MPLIDKLLYLNSKDASYNSVYDFTFNLNRTINNVKTIQLLNYNIAYATYNISSYNNNNIIKWTETGNVNTMTAILDDGIYSSTEIISQLKIKMDAATNTLNTWTISFNDITQKFTITASTADFVILYDTTTLRKALGLTSNGTSSSKILVMQTTADLLTSKQLEIHIPNIIRNYSSSLSSTSDDIIYLIPLTNIENFTYISNSFTGNELNSYQKDISQIIISIVDQSGYTPDIDFSLYPFSILFKLSVLE